MMRGTRGNSLAISVTGALLLAGCSSSTEPRSDAAAQGYALRIAVTPASPVVGDTLYATFTIENVTSAPITRTFADDWLQPQIRVVLGAENLEEFPIFGEWEPTKTLTLAPNQTVSGPAIYIAMRAGEDELTGCLPADVTTGANAICTDALVTVEAR